MAYGKEKAIRIARDANRRYEQLCIENKLESKAVQRHTNLEIYPCIALLDAQIRQGVPREVAIQFLFDYIECKSKRMENIIKKIMKIPGIYKKVPVLFGKMAKKNFGKAANFDAQYHVINKKEMRFDMNKCLYYDIFLYYQYPEMTQAYCQADDILYGNMHPKLSWERTKTLGNGDCICDFKIMVKK